MKISSEGNSTLFVSSILYLCESMPLLDRKNQKGPRNKERRTRLTETKRRGKENFALHAGLQTNYR